MQEEWRDVKGFEGAYQVSNLGRIKSLPRISIGKRGRKLHCKGQILCASKNSKGYPSVNMSYNQKERLARVHRLVAEAFIPNPNNYPFINHKDENKENNCVDNLEWCTPQYNVDYSQAIGITEFDTKGQWIKNWKSISLAEKTLHISSADICDCCKRRRYTAHNRIWRYTKPEYKEGYILQDIDQIPIKGEMISQFDREGNWIKNWSNSNIAASELGIFHGNIRSSKIGSEFTANNYIFRRYRPEYKEGYNLFNIDMNEASNRPIGKYDFKSGNLIETYASCLDAYKAMSKRGGVVNGWQRIYHCCKDMTDIAFTYKWKFLDV